MRQYRLLNPHTAKVERSVNVDFYEFYNYVDICGPISNETLQSIEDWETLEAQEDFFEDD